jgi:hypothetical protein
MSLESVRLSFRSAGSVARGSVVPLRLSGIGAFSLNQHGLPYEPTVNKCVSLKLRHSMRAPGASCCSGGLLLATAGNTRRAADIFSL